jgi:inosine/xanthosine triphosphate pyrophosphatase family protein
MSDSEYRLDEDIEAACHNIANAIYELEYVLENVKNPAVVKDLTLCMDTLKGTRKTLSKTAEKVYNLIIEGKEKSCT